VRLRILAAALALPLALSGALTACGGDPAAPPPLTPAPSTASSPTPTEQAETAEEFIRRWQAEADKMQTTGETESFLALTQGCAACEDFAKTVDRIYRNGGYIRFGGTTILSITRRAGTNYDYVARSGSTEYRERASGPIKRFSGGRSALGVELVRTSTGWLVKDSYRRPTGSP